MNEWLENVCNNIAKLLAKAFMSHNILEFQIGHAETKTLPHTKVKNVQLYGKCNTKLNIRAKSGGLEGQRFTNRMNFKSDMLKRKCCPYKK